jgi:hypothetical protein
LEELSVAVPSQAKDKPINIFIGAGRKPAKSVTATQTGTQTLGFTAAPAPLFQV